MNGIRAVETMKSEYHGSTVAQEYGHNHFSLESHNIFDIFFMNTSRNKNSKEQAVLVDRNQDY